MTELLAAPPATRTGVRSGLWIGAGMVVIAAVAAIVEMSMGRLVFGPDGRFGWWEGNIWSAEQSQRFADPYSFSHISHGLLFYALLWLAARRAPVRYRLLAAVGLEAAWEILENSPIVINRYRAVTISLGYVGDSVVNSLSDILMMSIGFLVAANTRPRVALALLLVLEIGLTIWVRDCLALNIVMLLHPIDAIRHWQMGQ